MYYIYETFPNKRFIYFLSQKLKYGDDVKILGCIYVTFALPSIHILIF